MAAIKKDFLWGNKPQFYVLDSNNVVLSEKIPPFNINKNGHKFSNQFEYSDKGETYLASSWSIFLRNRFFAPDWTLVISKSRSDILQPLQTFRRIFILLSLLSFMIVILLSITQIRRSLVPIEILKAIS